MYQFFHMSLYGRRPRRRGQAHETIAGIAAEAARLPGACPHVKEPKEPILVFGVSPLEAAKVADDRAQRARDAAGKRLRCDGAALAACVASYPLRTAMVRDDPGALTTYFAWQGDVLAWLYSEFGASLLSVVAHWDEEYPHLHAYVVPALGSDLRLRWEDAHPGRRAVAEAAARGAPKKEVNAAYVVAMRAMQDRYHEQVGTRYDHRRYGPRRRRLERAVAIVNATAKKAEEERQMQARVELQEATKLIREEYDRRLGAIRQDAAVAIEDIREKAHRDREMAQAKHAAIRRYEAQIAEQEAELTRLREILRENGLHSDDASYSL